MCEYSLLTLPNRLAIEGERLVSHRFPSFTIGLASAAEIEAATPPESERNISRSWWSRLKIWLSAPQCKANVTAVCVPPGARLRVSQLSSYLQRQFCLGAVEEVTFTELSAAAYEFRDAIRFANGACVLLQHLEEGVCFDVLSSGSTEPEVIEQEPDGSWVRLPSR
jgi:hypothetical protein